MTPEDEERPDAQHLDEERLIGYVSEALARRDEGEDVDVDELCVEHPHLAAAVAETLGIARVRHGSPAPESGSTAGGDAWVGHTLSGRYTLGARLGAGAMGAVYEATDGELGRTVAVKMLAPMFVEKPSHGPRFQREAEALAAIEHPSIVPVYDRGETEDGVAFLVMARLRGASLQDIVMAATERAGDRPQDLASTPAVLEEFGIRGGEESYVRQVLRWGLQIAEGLEQAHRAGVIHRDVKPSNVFVTEGGQAVLLDFGIAAFGESAGLTAGEAVGTPWYMAPEQASGADPAPQVDVYGVGALLYHLLTLHTPFEGTGPQVLLRMQREDPPPVRRFRPGLPPDVQAVLERTLMREPERRYGAPAELAADLAALLDYRPVTARRLGPARRLWLRARRRPTAALAGVAVAAAVVSTSVILPLWAAESARQREAAIAYEWQRIPPNLTLEAQRRTYLAHGAEWRQAKAHLDRILELDGSHVGARLLSWGMAIDRGELDDAREHLAFLSWGEGGFERLLENALAAAELGDDLVECVASVGFDDVATPREQLLVGYLQLRRRNALGAVRALRAARDYEQGRRIAEELLGAALLWRAEQSRDDRLMAEGLAQEAQELAVRLDDELRTAMTQHLQASALVMQLQYRTAMPFLERGLELVPEHHGFLQNLGIAHHRVDPSAARALELLRRAHVARPWLWNTVQQVVLILSEQGRYADALEWLDRLPDSGAQAWRREWNRGRILFYQTFEIVEAKGDGVAEVAAAGRDAYEAAATARGEAEAWAAERSLLDAVAQGRLEEVHRDLMLHAVLDSDSPVILQYIAALLERSSGGLNELDKLLVAVLLSKRAALNSPGNPIEWDRFDELWNLYRERSGQ